MSGTFETEKRPYLYFFKLFGQIVLSSACIGLLIYLWYIFFTVPV